jgi:copper(I)-binding protein
MRRFTSTSGRVALSCGLALALAAAQASALFVVNQPWVRPASRLQATEAYMNLTSTEGATLVAVTSAAADNVTIHAPGKSGRVSRLRLPAQTLVALAPNSYRLVLGRLVRTLKLGEHVPLTLTLEHSDGSRENIGVEAEVRLHSPIEDELRAHAHAH